MLPAALWRGDDAVTPRAGLDAEHRDDPLDGVTVLETDGVVTSLGGWEGRLYRPDAETDTESDALTVITLYVRDNREEGAMQVWIRST